MSYIQIEIGGKQRGLKFNQLAIEIISTHNDGGSTSAFMYALYYGGLRGNSYVKREEPDYNFEQVCDWVDEMKDKAKVNELVVNTLQETSLWKDLISVVQEEDVKKKAQKK
jgi:hypothetical protein